MTDTKRFQVGAWMVEPDLDQISGPAGDVLLMPKAMAVLVYLAERAGQVVSTDELVNTVWQGRPMGDNPVYKCITQLRTVLGDDRKDPTYIATVHTKGYRLIAPVVWPGAEEVVANVARSDSKTNVAQPWYLRSHLAWTGGIILACLLAAILFTGKGIFDGPGTESPAVAEQPSIAVLPFANMSPDPGQDYFADGLSEELITQLAALPGIRVIGRTSSFAFKGVDEDLRIIGQTLGVNHLLEGSVRKSGDRVRITAQLINPADGSHLWSHAYERSGNDIVTIQEEIAKTVASALRISIAARIVRQGGTQNFEAYDAFLAGLAAATAGGADNVVRSIAAFNRAVAIDPDFIAAWEALAGTYRLASVDIPERGAEWLEMRTRAEDRLLALAPNHPTVVTISAQREMSRGRLIEAERLFNSIRENPPGYGSQFSLRGIFLLHVGRPHDAITVFMRDQRTEPLALMPSLWLQIAYELAGDSARAESEYQRALEFVGDTRGMRTMALVRAMERRDTVAIRRELTEQIAAGRLTRRLNDAMRSHLDDPPLAVAELRRYLDEPANVNSNVVLMMISAWASYFGDPDLSLRAMGHLRPLADNTFDWAIWRPIHRGIRHLPDFKALVRERSLDDYWRVSGNWGDFCRPQGVDDFDCSPIVDEEARN